MVLRKTRDLSEKLFFEITLHGNAYEVGGPRFVKLADERRLEKPGYFTPRSFSNDVTLVSSSVAVHFFRRAYRKRKLIKEFNQSVEPTVRLSSFR